MKMKILFNGFRHTHINSLYKRARIADFAETCGCIEDDPIARAEAEKSLEARFSDMSYDEWLNTDINVVAIGNAYGERGKNIIKALRAGKHVITDKPICTDLHELEEIRRLSSENRLSVVCMLDLRYLPQTLCAKKILDGGELGEVRNVSFNGQHCMNYGKRPEWYFEEGMHGGTINDLAVHGIDLVRMLTDMEITRTDAAREWNSYAYKNKNFMDCAIFMARLENGAGVLADVSYSAPSQVFSMPTYWEFNFWCERGLLRFSYADKRVTVFREGVKEPLICDGIDSERDWLTDLLDEMRTGERSHTREALISTETALLIQGSAKREENV